jgi:hypothetical protein
MEDDYPILSDDLLYKTQALLILLLRLWMSGLDRLLVEAVGWSALLASWDADRYLDRNVSARAAEFGEY